jgi:hypothetical protein
VLAGETHFVKVEVRLPADALVEKGVRFEVTGEETCIADRNCGSSPIVVMQE